MILYFTTCSTSNVLCADNSLLPFGMTGKYGTDAKNVVKRKRYTLKILDYEKR